MIQTTGDSVAAGRRAGCFEEGESKERGVGGKALTMMFLSSFVTVQRWMAFWGASSFICCWAGGSYLSWVSTAIAREGREKGGMGRAYGAARIWFHQRSDGGKSRISLLSSNHKTERKNGMEM